MDAIADRDERALELRTGGTSFGAIARELEYRGAPNAYEAFLRAPAPISRPISSEPNSK